ncbi:hypothetical protein B484DRAFT_416531, partial [Ochromonadaceae sp. CCMP2298]
MSKINWSNVGSQSKPDVVEAFLTKADVATVVFEQDGKAFAALKDALFKVMGRFDRYPAIQIRAIQMLQDCQILSPTGVTDAELKTHFDVLLKTMDVWVNRTDILLSCFEFLAMVAGRAAVVRRCVEEGGKGHGQGGVVALVGRAMDAHREDRAFQLAGLVLYEAVLENQNLGTEKGNQDKGNQGTGFATIVFHAVVENLLLNPDEPALVLACYSLLCRVVPLVGPYLEAWVERLLGMVLTSVQAQGTGEGIGGIGGMGGGGGAGSGQENPGFVVKCISLLEKLALDQESLFVIASHPRCLLLFTDALFALGGGGGMGGSGGGGSIHLPSVITVLEYVLRILEHQQAAAVVMENIAAAGVRKLDFFVQFHSTFTACTDTIMLRVAGEGGAGGGGEAQVQYWLQLLEFANNILFDMVKTFRSEEEGGGREGGMGRGKGKEVVEVGKGEGKGDGIGKGPMGEGKGEVGKRGKVEVEGGRGVKGEVKRVKWGEDVGREKGGGREREGGGGAEKAGIQSKQNQGILRNWTPQGQGQGQGQGQKRGKQSAEAEAAERARVMEQINREDAAEAAATKAKAAAKAEAGTGTGGRGGYGSGGATKVGGGALTLEEQEEQQFQQALAWSAEEAGMGIGGGMGMGAQDVPTVLSPIYATANAADEGAVEATAVRELTARSSNKDAHTSIRGVTWQNLLTHNVDQVDAFLCRADVASAILGGVKDDISGTIKEAIFGCMRKYYDYPTMQIRCLQLLQDCHILCPGGVTTGELGNHFECLLRALGSWIDDTDVLLNLFEFFALVAGQPEMVERCGGGGGGRDRGRERDCGEHGLLQRHGGEHELLQLVGQALTLHLLNKEVQRAGLHFYEGVLKHTPQDRQRPFAKLIFHAVLENLLHPTLHSDPTICFTAYSILLAVVDKIGDRVGAWVDPILGLALSTIAQKYSPELTATCLKLVEKLALGGESLFVMAAHPRCIKVFTDALSILDVQYIDAAITAMEYLLRVLEDPEAMAVVGENILQMGLQRGFYFKSLRTDLEVSSDKLMTLAAQSDAIESVDDDALVYYLRLLELLYAALVVVVERGDEGEIGEVGQEQNGGMDGMGMGG